MIIFIRRSAQRLERTHLLTLLRQVSGCRRPIATTQIRQHDIIPLDRTVLAAQVYSLNSQQNTLEHLIPSKTPYTLVNKALKAINNPIVVGDALGSRPTVIGNGTPTISVDPCAVATSEHLLAPAHAARAAGAPILRAGAFRPRTSPSQFQGRGVAGLQLLAEARNAPGLPIITVVMEPGIVETVSAYADGLQTGSRTMHHFSLLVAARHNRHVRPVLLKGGLCASMEAWRRSAVSFLVAGYPKVILCERGICSFDLQRCSIFDLACVPLVRELTHLPNIVDPCHAAGAQGLILAVLSDSTCALCDGRHLMTPQQGERIISARRLMASMLQEPGKEVS